MESERDKLTEIIIGCAFQVINTLGCGFLEKVYENALAIELRTNGLKCKQQRPIQVSYRDLPVGDYFADILVDNQVILEIKATKVINETHQAQLINYLKASGFHRGLILNFGTTKLGVKRKVF